MKRISSLIVTALVLLCTCLLLIQDYQVRNWDEFWDNEGFEYESVAGDLKGFLMKSSGEPTNSEVVDRVYKFQTIVLWVSIVLMVVVIVLNLVNKKIPFFGFLMFLFSIVNINLLGKSKISVVCSLAASALAFVHLFVLRALNKRDKKDKKARSKEG